MFVIIIPLINIIIEIIKEYRSDEEAAIVILSLPTS